MYLRRVPALTTLLAVALTLTLSACAQSVTGVPVAAPGAKTGSPTSGKPTSTKTSSPTSGKTTASTPASGTKPSGKVKITTKKKTEGYEDCDLLTPEEVAAAVGAKTPGAKGCVQSTQDPLAVVLFMVTFDDHEGDAKEIEVGGNTAYQIKDGNDCSVVVMLTDDPDAITPAFLATVTPIDEMDTCAIALTLATQGFAKIPNA
jgi:hypothetical protein